MRPLPLRSPADLDALVFRRVGDADLVTVVAQDADSGAVLMVAHADREALGRTLASGEMWYWSRTRGLWHKGETSGNVQRVVALFADCDGDAVLAQVRPAGPSCHAGTPSCFGRAVAGPTLQRLSDTIASRALTRDTSSYTARLLGDRNLRLKKLGEECAELAVACADGDTPRAVSEAADVLYHVLVALRALDAGLPDVQRELGQRASS
jgi:phosphoribosyl-ATP pyrophosphohydrolase/phosphoribosyl-AMP cyclohydrolase